MTQLDLTKIGFFNPGRLNDDEIEMTFVARKPLFEHLFKKIIDHSSNDIPQHLLIIGQRGMGKTSLLLRIAVELKKEPYNKLFIPLTFPEEQYNIDRLSKFWLNSLDALADALDREKKLELVKELDAEIAAFSSLSPEKQNDGFELFEKWTKKVGRRSVLLVDNLNLIFDKISLDDQHRLRAILIQAAAPIIVGASSTSITQTVDYGQPFYDAFQTTYLSKLDLAQSIEILKNLGQITTGDHSLDHLFTQNHSRIAALHHLTGGTPRTLTMLFPLIRNGFNKEIQYDLEALLDVITPLYKARFEELSSQMQVILDAIALNWDPIDLENLRKTTQIPNSALSPQIKRLIDIGWIRKLETKKSKGGLYEISERFFNVWYLMRRSSRRQIRELYCLTKFLEVFYGPDVDSVAKSRLGMDQHSANHISWDLALAGATKDENLKAELESKSYRSLLDLASSNSDILKNFDVPDDILHGEVQRLLKFNDQHIKLEAWGKIINNYQQILVLLPELKLALYGLGITYKINGQHTESIEAFENYIKWDKCDPEEKVTSLISIGRIYFEHFEERATAKDYFKRALNLDPENILALQYLSQSLESQKHEELEPILKKLITITPEDKFTHLKLGMMYSIQQKNFEAIEHYKKALKLGANTYQTYSALAISYVFTGQSAEAEKIIIEALKLHPTEGTLYYQLGITHENSEKPISEIIPLYDKALELGNIKVKHKNNLGNFYLNHTDEHQKSLTLLLDAIVETPEDSLPTYNLIFLLRDKLNQRKDAMEMLGTIPEDLRIKDTHALHEALFAYYEQNLGNAKTHILSALEAIKSEIPSNTQDNWWRSAATIVKLGHGQHFVEILKESGYDIVLRPYYEAIRALLEKDPESHFNTIAAEVREPARKILEFMQRYNSN